MGPFDRPDVYAVAAICFGLVLARCWWAIRRENAAAAAMEARLGLGRTRPRP